MAELTAFNSFYFFGFSYFFDLLLTTLVTIFLVPILLISYSAVKWSRKCWVRFIKWKYPNCIIVEKNSIRSILDQGRNQGIYTLLVQGASIADGARSHLRRLTSTRPFLRMALTAKWGLYTWENLEDFSVDNHLVHSPNSFKGRAITEMNIQGYVSDVTSKYLPSNHSPWQVHVINCIIRGEESKFCVVRVHHLLLRQEHLTLGDFLPLKYSPESWTFQESNSPFTNPYTEPSALPHLHQKLTESFSNIWNEFLCNNDPIERPEILKKSIGLFQSLKIAIIVVVSTIKELMRQYRKPDNSSRTMMHVVFKREASKRNFGFGVVFHALLAALNPIAIMRNVFAWAWYLSVTLSLKSPIIILRELRALKSSQKHYYPDTLTSIFSCYLPLFYHATLELISIAMIIIRASRSVLDELFLRHGRTNRLLTISPCGRKIVAWSEEVDIEILDKISNMTGAHEVEILLAAIVDSLKEYFREMEMPIPQDVLTTVKFDSQKALFLQNHETRGLLCFALPTRTPLFDNDLVEILQVIQKNVQEARSKQSAIYAITAAEASFGLLTSCLPSILLKIVLNHLTRRYSLSLTQVDGDVSVEGVLSAMYWKPPQGNCSMSITLHRHEKGVRLGVMADAVIGPQHSIITKSFPRSIRNLAMTVGIPHTPSRSPSPNPTSPMTSPGLY